MARPDDPDMLIGSAGKLEIVFQVFETQPDFGQLNVETARDRGSRYRDWCEHNRPFSQSRAHYSADRLIPFSGLVVYFLLFNPLLFFCAFFLAAAVYSVRLSIFFHCFATAARRFYFRACVYFLVSSWQFFASFLFELFHFQVFALSLCPRARLCSIMFLFRICFLSSFVLCLLNTFFFYAQLSIFLSPLFPHGAFLCA